LMRCAADSLCIREQLIRCACAAQLGGLYFLARPRM
jgi:hypothetical protein